jgi:two-component system, cell cycle response regulator DivK
MALQNKRRVLLVDDCDDSREIYASFLDRKGFEVVEAATGTSGLDSAFARRPDVVVLDVDLPDVDGLQALHRLKLDGRTQGVPVILLSGYQISAPESVVGWDAYLLKPCLPDQLLSEIERVLENKACARSA